MHVLRTARELTAQWTGRPLEEVGLDFPVAKQESSLRGELWARVVESLRAEQLAEALGDEPLAASWPGWGPGRSDQPEGELASVASVAAVVTRAAVRSLISFRLDVPVAEVSPGLNFTADLGADSLTRVDLVLLLEEQLDVSVPDDSMALIQTVGDAELFAVLFDRVREALVVALGEEARGFGADRELRALNPQAPQLALESASAAVGVPIELPAGDCRSLKEAVRIAFLLEKLRETLAGAAGVARREVTTRTVPERDLGLDAARSKQVFETFSRALDLGPVSLPQGHREPVAVTLRALASLAGNAAGGMPR